MKKIPILLGLLLAFVYACNNTDTAQNYLDKADCTGVDADANSYTLVIKDILDNNCASSGCHNASSRESGVDLSTYAKAKAAFQNTECLCSIHHGSECKAMPQGSGKLDDATIQLIDCWAKNGYKE